MHLLSNAVGDDKQKNEKERVGRYQIKIVKKGEDYIIYRLDSFTGNVSVFDTNEDEILSRPRFRFHDDEEGQCRCRCNNPVFDLVSNNFKPTVLFMNRFPIWICN